MLRILTPEQPEEERRRWVAVRLDTHETLPGLILAANADTGIAVMRVVVRYDVSEAGVRTAVCEPRDYSLGANGLMLVRRR